MRKLHPSMRKSLYLSENTRNGMEINKLVTQNTALLTPVPLSVTLAVQSMLSAEWWRIISVERLQIAVDSW